jgi:hypothetical protein
MLRKTAIFVALPLLGFVYRTGNEFLANSLDWCRFPCVKTLTVEEAVSGLGRLVELALAGEQIQIRKGSGVVELRPAQATQTAVDEKFTPREALRRLQEDALLTPQHAEGICANCAGNG